MSSPPHRVFSVVGARPHFVKASPFMKAMTETTTEVITVHTGQHYDVNMSEVFFRELGLPTADYNLGVGSGTHADQTAAVLTRVEELMIRMEPEAVVVYGDTNSTLGAALAAAKLYIPVVHVEAGVRCANRRMPEEINRKVIDHVSDYLICPSELAVRNLEREGVSRGVMNVGDLMYDTFLAAQDAAMSIDPAHRRYGVEPGEYYLSTLHREATTASIPTLRAVLDTLGALDRPVLLPVHPRTRARIAEAGLPLERADQLVLIEPVGYLEMVSLLKDARRVLTDSGGVQKEAYWAGVPCVTLMTETTWPETIDAGWNVLVGLDPDAIRAAVHEELPGGERSDVYGAPGAADRMVEMLGWN